LGEGHSRLAPVALTLVLALPLLSGCPEEEPDPVDPCGPVYAPVAPLSGLLPELADESGDQLGDAPQPRRLRTGFFEDPATSFTVLWETDPATDVSVVEWGLGGELQHSKTAYSYLVGEGQDGELRMHEARLCDLETGGTYSFRVGAEGAFSETLEYTLFDPDADTLSFVALGDSRSSHDVLGQLMEAADVRQPRMYLFTGDFVSLGNNLAEWAGFFDGASPVVQDRPLVPVHGNHELFAEAYFAQVAAPGNEEWFSMDLGPVHLAVLNDSRGGDDLEEQAAWLDADLAAAESPFLVVSHHYPPYSSGNHGSNVTIRSQLAPIFDAHGVQLVINGHDHGYERTLPLRDDQVQDEPGTGTVYVVSGGAGAPLYGFDGDWFTAHTESAFHYCLFEVTQDRLNMSVYRLDGSLMDEVEILP
jgi:acid phosphatase type 7